LAKKTERTGRRKDEDNTTERKNEVRSKISIMGSTVAMVPPLLGRRASDGAEEKTATPVGKIESEKTENGTICL
jgi:hypothetical protein